MPGSLTDKAAGGTSRLSIQAMLLPPLSCLCSRAKRANSGALLTAHQRAGAAGVSRCPGAVRQHAYLVLEAAGRAEEH